VTAHPTGRRTAAAILTGAAALALSLAAACVAGLWWLRASEMADAVRDYDRLARALAEQTDLAFGEIDAAIKDVRRDLQPDWLAGAGTAEALHRRLHDRYFGLPQGQALLLFGVDGRMAAHSREWPTPKVTVLDRPYFQAHAANPEDVLEIGGPTRNRVNGGWMITVSRRLSNPAGGFAGVAMAAVELSYFDRLYRSLSLPEGTRVELLRADGTMLAVDSAEDALLGRVSDSCRAPAPGNVAVLRRLAALPVEVCIAVPRKAVLVRWHRLAWAIGAATAAAVAAILALTAALAARVREIEAQRQSLLRSNAELEQFAFVASHDLQTPLRNVASYAQLLERRFSDRLDDDGREFIGFIVDGTKRMSAMIHDLLDYSRISTRAAPARPVPAGHAVDKALANLAALVAESGAGIAAAGLPAVLVDETQLVSLFQNLIENAIKYRHPERRPAITLSAEADGRHAWQFTVADNGIGIEAQYFDKIFDMFQRLDPRTYPEGNGIGLSLCRRIVQRLGGDIRVRSTVGEGTAFSFTLPAA